LRRFAISALALVLLAAAGCGGGGRLTRAEYAKKADAICVKYNGKINALDRPKNEAELVGYVDKAVPLVKDASGELADLKPPQDEQHTADAWNKANADVAVALQHLREGAKAKDQAKMQAALKDGNTANSRANNLARTLGMTSCAQ
jgi:hypothetical protein